MRLLIALISAVAGVLHHRPPRVGAHLPRSPTHPDRVGPGGDLGGLRAQPVQDRPEDRGALRAAGEQALSRLAGALALPA